MSKNEHTNEYYERMLLHTDCITSRGRRIKPIEYFVKVNAVVIPENATFGEVIKAVFPDVKWYLNEDNEVFTDHKTRNSSTIRVSADTVKTTPNTEKGRMTTQKPSKWRWIAVVNLSAVLLLTIIA